MFFQSFLVVCSSCLAFLGCFLVIFRGWKPLGVNYGLKDECGCGYVVVIQERRHGYG